MAYQLGAKPLPKPMMTLPEGANLCGISINFCTLCAAVSIILMTYPVISKHFRYFFQFLQIQVEETYFSMKSLWICDFELIYKNTTEKNLYSAHFYGCFYGWHSAHFCCCFISLENYNFLQGKILHVYPFQTFWKFLSQFLPLQVEKNYFFQGAITVSGFTSHGRNM